MIPTDRKYTQQHEWVMPGQGMVTIGITDHAQEQLADIVFVELPEIGRRVKAGESIVVLESVRTKSDIFAPLTGTVVAVNEELVAHPEKVNESPYDEGWIVKIKIPPHDLSKLMDAAAYEAFVAGKKP